MKMTEDIKKLIESHSQLAQQALELYTPLVDNLIATKNTDVNHICLTLDYMLGFCYDDNMLLLYRRLCRYLFDIDPQATASYIEAFRDMWDEEGVKFGNKKKEG